MTTLVDRQVAAILAERDPGPAETLYLAYVLAGAAAWLAWTWWWRW